MSAEHLPVAVSGAAGFIGSAVVRRLLATGRRVRLLLEPGASTVNANDLPAEVERVTVDVCDYDGMARALDNTSAFYHLAAIYRVWTPDPRAIYRVNVEGTTTSLLAAKAAGVPRIIYTSSIAAVGLAGDGKLADETFAFNLFDIANEYLLTKWLSERIAMNFAAAGLPIVVVNPAFPFGPRDRAPTPTGKMVLSMLQGRVPGYGPGGFCAVDVDDVAVAHVTAEARGRIGERYILGAHNVSFREFLEVCSRVSGQKMPRLYMPGAMGTLAASAMELWSDHVSHKEPLATRKSVQYLQRNVFFDCSKAKNELLMPVTPLETTIERAVRFFRDAKMV